MADRSNLGRATRRLIERGLPHPEPLLYQSEALDYLCRAAALEHPELGAPPAPPTGQWAIDAGRAAPEESFVQAELVERIEDDEDGEGSSFGDGMRALFGAPSLDCQII